MVAVDYVPGFEARMSAADAVTRYAAFVSDCLTRYEATGALRRERPALWRLIRSEADRLRISAAAAWTEGVALAADASEMRPA